MNGENNDGDVIAVDIPIKDHFGGEISDLVVSALVVRLVIEQVLLISPSKIILMVILVKELSVLLVFSGMIIMEMKIRMEVLLIFSLSGVDFLK